MLERKAYGRLLEWKEKVPGRALLVEGARQVGKTYLVGEFARREFGSCVKVDFLHGAAAPAPCGPGDRAPPADRPAHAARPGGAAHLLTNGPSRQKAA